MKDTTSTSVLLFSFKTLNIKAAIMIISLFIILVTDMNIKDMILIDLRTIWYVNIFPLIGKTEGTLFGL